ncbi:unnamed protein product [Moneuplotes crassus]|uniref:Tetratricopeptide repeat protein n=1 Tax=Euplotes crassus TaxID=5936 RepID=A0AAD1XBH8_EUPCR|nr:unnamed protein product [Moneuplotes crassus]
MQSDYLGDSYLSRSNYQPRHSQQEDSDEDEQIDPRIRSFMTIVTKEISEKSTQEKNLRKETLRRQEVESELSRIRYEDSQIQKQNELSKTSLADIENINSSNNIRRSTYNQNQTQELPQDSVLSQAPKEENKMDQSDVDTLITRVHQYYERMHKEDQENFFESQGYFDAEKYDSFGRDMSIIDHDKKGNTKPHLRKNFENYPRPMNLEQRFAAKKVSPGKYRCFSCEKQKGDNRNSSPKLRPFAENPEVFKEVSKSVKKSILETQMLLSKGKLEEAQRVIGNVLRQGHDHSDAYFLSGEIDRQLGMIKNSEEKLLKALTFQVYTPKVYFSLGLVYNSKQEFDKSVRCFKKFLFSVETPEAHFELAVALMGLNNPSEACIHFSRAITLDPEESDYYLKRAKCYEAQGLEELAQEDYNTVLRIDPASPQQYVSVLDTYDIA